MNKLYGQTHLEILKWLCDSWWNDGSTIFWLEGFPGVGKTEIHRHLMESMRNQNRPAVYFELPGDDGDPMEALLFTLAQDFAASDRNTLANKLDGGATQIAAQSEIVKWLTEEQGLLVLDEFQFCLDDNGQPTGPLWKFLNAIRKKSGLKGRILLLTDRHPHEGTWSENIEWRRLPSLNPQEGLDYLSDLLNKRNREAAVPEERLADVVAWVDGNPRALRAVVAAMDGEDLDALIELQPESWRLREREISPGLLHELEIQLVGKVLARLEEADKEVLFGVSVYRKPFQAKGFDLFLKQHPDHPAIRARLMDNLLLRKDGNWYSLEKVAREVVALHSAEKPERYRGAHSTAGGYYARHFLGKQIVGAARLGGDFVEAKFHWVQAKREQDLREVVQNFESHIRAEVNWVSPVPANHRDLDERIAMLSVLLNEPRAPSWHYHLARCLEKRGQTGDLARALKHAELALQDFCPYDAWLLAIRLTNGVKGLIEAITLAKKGTKAIPEDKNLQSVYLCAAELLARNSKRSDEAVELLREGISRIPSDNNVVELYQFAAELLARDPARIGEAVALLR
ncbi:hypothetical protein HC024_10020, partial [Methylococcaceae bacterium WWC4]|nr:hypothetical protein [Methylococcaceae bacterium WWC4]